MSTPDWAGHAPAGGAESARGNRRWWDAQAGEYHAEHGAFLGDRDLVWGPEGWREEELGLLCPLDGARVLEIGAGAGQGAHWCADHGAQVVASDLSPGMLRVGAGLDAGQPRVAADAGALPFADAAFDLVFSAYGAVPFVADTAALMREVARVLRPGGRFVFSTTHPVRWAFPDVPGPAGLTASHSYFDRTPYVERTGAVVGYAEHHRTLGDRIRELVAAGFAVRDVVEPEWPARNTAEWGGWSPLRGRLLPGTAIYVAQLAARGCSGACAGGCSAP